MDSDDEDDGAVITYWPSIDDYGTFNVLDYKWYMCGSGKSPCVLTVHYLIYQSLSLWCIPICANVIGISVSVQRLSPLFGSFVYEFYTVGQIHRKV